MHKGRETFPAPLHTTHWHKSLFMPAEGIQHYLYLYTSFAKYQKNNGRKLVISFCLNTDKKNIALHAMT